MSDADKIAANEQDLKDALVVLADVTDYSDEMLVEAARTIQRLSRDQHNLARAREILNFMGEQ